MLNCSTQYYCLLLRTPGPVPFGTCICSNVETILSWTCHVYGPFKFRTSLGSSILIDNLLCNIDAGKLTGVVFIDLSKAFDTVNHDVLLRKLLSFGICKNNLNWLSSYLRNRTKCVKWKGVLSKEKNVTIGVLRGRYFGLYFLSCL